MVFGLVKCPWNFLPDSVGSIALGMSIGFVYQYFNPDANLSGALFFDP